MKNFRTWSRRTALGLALALGVGGFVAARANQSSGTSWPAASLKLADSNEGPSHNSFAPILKSVTPAVVNISSSRVVRTEGTDASQMDPFFRNFFGGDLGPMNPPREQREKGLGSGVIVSPNGYILTNNHVVDKATDIRVTLSDKREFKAQVVGTDPRTDVALLKIDESGLPAITIGDSSKIQVGDYALAIGDPFGIGRTVTMGIVSATGRSNLGIEDYEDFIQTDAPINPGNSGGALINDRGELIGINTAIVSESGGNQGIGFAVPINLARQVMDDLLKYGKVSRAYLGIYPQDVTPAMAAALGEKEVRGVLVGDVSPDSPARKSGIQRGDIILEVNGKPVNDSNELRMSVSMMPADSTVKLKVLRGQGEQDYSVQLAEFPGQQEAKASTPGRDFGSLEGVRVETLDSQTAEQLGLPADSSGVVVTDISPSSPVADSGLRKGDVIQEVNRQPVKNVADFERAVQNSKQEPLLLVNRRGTTMFVAV